MKKLLVWLALVVGSWTVAAAALTMLDSALNAAVAAEPTTFQNTTLIHTPAGVFVTDLTYAAEAVLCVAPSWASHESQPRADCIVFVDGMFDGERAVLAITRKMRVLLEVAI